MRAILALSAVLLGLTLLFEHAPEIFPSPALEPAAGADRALELFVGAKGPLLPAAHLGAGPDALGEVLRIGDRILVGEGSQGLRAVFVLPSFALRGARCYDVADSVADRRALVASVAGARPGEVLVLASSGRLEPRGERTGWDELEDALARLGARARPGHATPESWALIALRAERAWVALAEGYSQNSGVALTRVIGPRLLDDPGAAGAGEFIELHATGPREIRLAEELAHASVQPEDLRTLREASVQGRRMPAWLVLPRPEGNRLAWEGLELDAGSGLVVWVGIPDDAPRDLELDFEVRIDGTTLGPNHRRVRAGEPWRPVQVDLRALAGRRVTLELVVTGPRVPAGLLLAHPTLVLGYDRSPLDVWAGR